MTRTTIDALLRQARARLHRVGRTQARHAMDRGAMLIDIRTESQRAADGWVPGAVVVARNVLEWRLDPDCPHRLAGAPALEDLVIVMRRGLSVQPGRRHPPGSRLLACHRSGRRLSGLEGRGPARRGLKRSAPAPRPYRREVSGRTALAARRTGDQAISRCPLAGPLPKTGLALRNVVLGIAGIGPGSRAQARIDPIDTP